MDVRIAVESTRKADDAVSANDAVVRLGAVLLVKVDGALSVNELTAAQQAMLDHDPRLSLAPDESLTALSLTPATEHSASR